MSAPLPEERISATPITNDDIRHEAAGNLAFLLSVIRCGEQLSGPEEENVRRVIRDLNLSQGALTPVGEIEIARLKAELALAQRRHAAAEQVQLHGWRIFPPDHRSMWWSVFQKMDQLSTGATWIEAVEAAMQAEASREG